MIGLNGQMQTKYKVRERSTYKRTIGCLVEGCPSPHLSFGLCRKHVKRFRKYGDPNYTKLQRTGRCLIVDCEAEPKYRKGLCEKHRKEKLRLARARCAEPGCQFAAKHEGFCGHHRSKP